MAINFPNNPADGQQLTQSGITYTYNATKSYWKSVASSSGGGSLEATASGALANGDKVVVNFDGTVSVVSETIPTESLGSPTV